MPAQFILNAHPMVQALHQEGLLERAFADALAPNMLFRSEAFRETAEGNMGTTLFQSRRGLLPTITRARRATDGDVTPQRLAYEQWEATLQRFQGGIDTSLTENAHAIASVLGSDIHALGLQAAMSINAIARNGLYLPYLSGHTTLIDAGLAADVTIHVSALNGFRTVVIRGTNAQPAAVSTAFPLPITIIGATTITRNVIVADPDNADDPDGPGTLTLSAALGAGFAARSAILSSARPQIIRAGGGNSIDAIASTDIVTLQDFINATTRLRNNRVPPHEDGTYHCHIPNEAVAQIFADEVWQRLHRSMPDGDAYKDLVIARIAGITFYSNTECPSDTNAGDTVATGSNALYSRDIASETINETGVRVGRCIITGRGALYERWFDAKKGYVSEAGMTGVQGDFVIVNNGITYDTDGIRLVMAAPTDRTMDLVRSTWDVVTCFPAPSDVAAGGPERFKRAVALEFALT